MDPECLSIFRCLLCCQDEEDDTIDFVDIPRAVTTIQTLLQRPHLSQPTREPSYTPLLTSTWARESSSYPARSSLWETAYSSPHSVPEVAESSLRRSGSNRSSVAPNPKHTLRREPSRGQGKASYTVVESGESALYMIPECDKDLIENDVPPEVLRTPLTPFTYKAFFSALLYAEDYYCEKWSDFKLKEVVVELQKASVYVKSRKPKHSYGNERDEDKMFAVFRINEIPERRPFLLSRDFANARPSASNGRAECFQGIIYRVVKSDLILVDFKDDFHAQHYPGLRYDISFSFNRVCLKRAHEALNSVSNSLLKNFLFPSTCISQRKSTYRNINSESLSTVCDILKTESAPPYLIAGPICVSEDKASAFCKQPSKTGLIICEAVIQICKTKPHCKILICSPSNSACDVLMRSLKRVIPEPQMFRANAAFREREDVPEDILSSSLYKEECFLFPPLNTLSSFKVILSTFTSSYRLHSEGLPTGHFTHIFMVDSSFAIEPEALVPLANFAEAEYFCDSRGQSGMLAELGAV